MIFNTKPILPSIQKDVLPPHHSTVMIPPHHNNSLIYLFRCSCSSHYIGRINQRLDARIKLHVPTKIHNFIGGRTDNLRNTYGSSIAENLINNCDCAVNFSVDLFSILSKSHSSFHLKVFETIFIFILSGRHSLCLQRECLLGLNIIFI